jgi:hypothetical protein
MAIKAAWACLGDPIRAHVLETAAVSLRRWSAALAWGRIRFLLSDLEEATEPPLFWSASNPWLNARTAGGLFPEEIESSPVS